jgi:hypothetical protein
MVTKPDSRVLYNSLHWEADVWNSGTTCGAVIWAVSPSISRII